MAEAAEDRDRAVAGNEYVITVADTRALDILETHPLPFAVRPLVLAVNESSAYLQPALTHAFVHFDFRRRKLLRRRELPVKPGVVDAPSWAVNSPEESLCSLANTRSNTVSKVEYETATEVATVAVGRAPKHISVASIPASIAAAVHVDRD